MGHFTDAAYKILETESKPLSAKELCDIGLRKGVLTTKGKTPWQTMKSKLSTDILNKKSKSLFMRADLGKFALRKWKNIVCEEYIADRFIKTIMDEDIVVFPANSIHKYIDGPGLHTIPITNGRQLLNECKSMSRKKAEKDFSVIQLVSVFIIKWNSKYLTYKRTKRLPENRLHGFYSVAFGGHITKGDIPSLWDIFQPENYQFLLRELKEELILPEDQYLSTSYLGLLYDESRDISRQHLGIVYNVDLLTNEYQIGERGFLIDPKFESIHEMQSRINEFENWSVKIIDFENRTNSIDTQQVS